ncbi:MAG: heavy metal-associated domain-containing protein [Clostridiaceae bacterium]|nr:heavy metal-associated domain-containing protein [Clostridiaceae bacterium]
MKKTFRLEELDCANCAAKMEAAIRKLDGVQSVTISFMTQRLTLEASDSDFDAIVKQAAAICRKIEPDCRILV